MVGLKGINIVSLKTSMSASQTDHLGHPLHSTKSTTKTKRETGKSN